MTARKSKSSDPVEDLEAQIEKLKRELEKARSKKLKAQEQEVARCGRAVDAAKNKLAGTREKLKASKATLKTRKTAAANRQVEKYAGLVTEQKAALEGSRKSLAEAKSELANLKQSYKLALTVARALRQAEKGALAKANKPGSRSAAKRRQKSSRASQVKKLLQARNSVKPTSDNDAFDPARPSLFGDD